MRHASLLAIVAILSAGLQQPAAGQYHDTQVLQKSFETADFFFAPSYLNPYGLEGFGPVVPGLVGDPLLDLQLSPSLAGADSAFAYLDFRNTQERSGYRDYLYYPATVDIAASDGAASDVAFGYPIYYGNSYRPAEPVLSAALFFRPSRRLPGLTTGLTYRALTDDQSYYDVPQDIYRSLPGLDFAGDEAASSQIAITDIYAGADQMHTLGHFPSLYLSYALTNGWRVGARVAFARFDRDGEFGSTWNQPYSSRHISESTSFEVRSQTYRHTDVSFGVDGLLDEDTHAGGTIGWLAGKADQIQESESFYQYTYGDQSGTSVDYSSNYLSGGESLADWRRDGSSAYASAFVRRRLDQDRLVTFAYRGTRQMVDLDGSMAVQDSSFSESWSRGSAYDYQYTHRSRLADVRSGTGEETGTAHRLSVGLDWKLGENSRLVLGLVGSHTKRSTETTEHVAASRYRFHDNEWNGGSDRYQEEVGEDKDLEWSFSSRKSALRVPVILWHELGDHFELMVGVTREMADWRISEQTLAVFNFRNSEINGEIDNRTNFGERYREPTEYRTDVATTGIIGITARPADSFDVRLLVSPQWSDAYNTRRTQWWLGFQFRP